MDQLTVHTPGLRVFVLTRMLFKLDCLMTSKALGRDRLCQNSSSGLLHASLVLQDERISWDTEGSMRDKGLFGLAELPSDDVAVFSSRALWADGQQAVLPLSHSVTLWIFKWSWQVYHLISLSVFPNHNSGIIATFLRGEIICSFVRSAQCCPSRFLTFSSSIFFLLKLGFRATKMNDLHHLHVSNDWNIPMAKG